MFPKLCCFPNHRMNHTMTEKQGRGGWQNGIGTSSCASWGGGRFLQTAHSNLFSPTLPNPGCLLFNESLPHIKWEELSKSLLKQQKASHLWKLSCSLPPVTTMGKFKRGVKTSWASCHLDSSKRFMEWGSAGRVWPRLFHLE